MKPKLALSTFAATALLFAVAPLTARSQTWQMLLPSPGEAPAGLGGNLLIDPFHSSPAAGVLLAIQKSSLDGPEVPSILRLTPTDASSSNFSIEPLDGGLVGGRLAYVPGDGLYTAGYSVTTTGSKGNAQTIMKWQVRRSSEADQGNSGTWSNNDSYQLSGITKGKTTAYNSRAHAFTSDDSGNVYVCGWANDGKVHHWIIRRKTSSGWSKVYDATATDNYSIPYGICFVPAVGNNPAPALFVAGIFNNRWTVLRSLNQGDSWQAVGPWPADVSMASATDLARDGDGNIYVCGVRGRDGQNRGWVLRKSSNGGQDWVTLLDQPSVTDSWAVRLTIDAANNITVAGAIDAADGTPRWAIVRNSPGQTWSGSPTASWETRIFPLGPNTPSPSKGRGMATDAAGNMFLTGDVIDWTDPADGTYYSGTRVGLLRMTP
jgi:hypothetical protein